MKEGWEKKKLGDCFSYIKNGANIKQEKDAGGLPITRIETLSGGVFNRDRMGYANIDDNGKYDSFILNNGDLLLSHINSKAYIGRTVLYEKEGSEKIIHGMNLLRLIPIGQLLCSKFFFYHTLCDTFKAYIARIRKDAVNQSSIAISDLKNIPIPVPPLSVQESIVSELDMLSGIISKHKALQEEYDRLEQSIFYDMFGDPVTNEKGWEVKKLEEVCEKITDGTHDTPERLTEGVKFITGKHIRPGFIDYENSDYVTEEVHKVIYTRCNPEYGDVLYTNIGANLANAAMNIVHYEFSMKNVALLKLKKEKLDGMMLSFYLNNSKMKDKIINNYSNGGAQKFLSLKSIALIPVFIPPLSLQQSFADKISAIEQMKAKNKAAQEEAEMLFNERMAYYF